MYGAIAGSISGGLKGWSGAVAEKKAAAALQEGRAGAEATALEEEQAAYDAEMGRLDPYKTLGADSMTSLRDLLGYNGPDKQAAAVEALRNSPAFQFRLKTDADIIDRSAAGKGNLKSGRTLMALQDRGQQLASTEYGAEFNRRKAMADMGYGVSTDFAGLEGNHYRTRGDIRSRSKWLGGVIQAGKWKGYGAVSKDAFDSSAKSWGADDGGSGGGGDYGSWFGSGKKKTSYGE